MTVSSGSQQNSAGPLPFGDRAASVQRWLALAYGSDVTGTLATGHPHLAARMLPAWWGAAVLTNTGTRSQALLAALVAGNFAAVRRDG